ncbi:quinone oxidoreductase family protein [Dactylosporangium sp. CA-092794]|uniref:quinone oxidoreductase family protein n=1 Tax=Dactylosporangium sp. CA-092794 TaxID=3239929 RepID=UPI003D923B52
MHAAVVRSFGTPPRYESFPAPEPAADHEILVDVLAVGLHPRVRSSADGSHYTSDGTLPLVPGIDAVGRTAAGDLLYFVAPDTAIGTMAERAVVDRRRAVPLPHDTDPVAVAAAMNPGMSSWVALRRRIAVQPGAEILVLGATGNAGQLAVQIAKLLGAKRVVAAGRDPSRLALLKDLGADDVLELPAPHRSPEAAPASTVPTSSSVSSAASSPGESAAVPASSASGEAAAGRGPDAEAAARLAEAAADVDVVIDYVWGPVTERLLPALLTARSDRGKPLTWLEIGSVSGPEITLPSYLLRAANVALVGSGQGSVPTAAIVAELPSLAAEIAAGTLTVNPVAVPLARVEEAWSMPTAPGERLVLIP